MFNKKPLIKWLLICLVLSSVYSFLAVKKPKSNQKDRLQAFAMDYLRKEHQKKDKTPSTEDARKGIEKLVELREKHPNPKDLFEKIRDNYNFDTYMRITEKPLNLWSNSGRKWDEQEKGFCEFNDLCIAEFSLSDHNYTTAAIRLRVRMELKEYLTIKGKWSAVGFIQKISNNPEAQLPAKLPSMLASTKMTGGSSFSSNDSNEITNQIAFSMDSSPAFIDHEPLGIGLYAMQYHLYPDRLMAQTADGVIESAIYYLRIKE